MAETAVSRTRTRLLAGLAALASVAFVTGVTWAAWRAAPRNRPPAAPPIDIPRRQLVTVAAPAAAPPLDLPTADGNRFSLATARGQVVLVNFWATWCQPCVEEMPSIVRLARESAGHDAGKLRVVAVSLDERPEAVQQFFSAPPYAGPPPEVVLALEPGGGEVSRAYHCQGLGGCRPEDVVLPESYVLDKEGRMVAIVVGAIDWSAPGVRQYLEALLARHR